MVAWFNTLDPKIQAMLIAVGTSFLTVVATKPLDFFFTQQFENRKKRKAELADRLDRDVNIRKNVQQAKGSFGRYEIEEFLVNPFWIEWEGGKCFIRQDRTFELMEEYVEHKAGQISGIPKDIPLTATRVERSKLDKEWMVFTKDAGALRLSEREVSKISDRHLFQPLPPEGASHRLHNLLNLFRR